MIPSHIALIFLWTQLLRRSECRNILKQSD